VGDLPGLRTACHSSGDFWTGKVIFFEDEELNRDPNNGIGMDDLKIDGLEAAARRSGANVELLSVLVALVKKSRDLKREEKGGSFIDICIELK
jgi:hypothetical protein